jgi:uncharacterized protein (TIGR02118 family)
MVRFTVFYPQPNDVEAFERHYFGVHVPMAKKLPGLRRYTVSRNPRRGRGAEPYFMIAELDWDDMASLEQDFSSPLGQEIARDVDTLSAWCPGLHSMIADIQEA